MKTQEGGEGRGGGTEEASTWIEEEWTRRNKRKQKDGKQKMEKERV